MSKLDQRWLEMLSDEARADVMKTYVAETEKTERTRIEHQELIECDKDVNDRRLYITVWIVIGAVLCASLGTCAYYRGHESPPLPTPKEPL